MNASALLQYIDDHQQRLFDLLCQLIAIPSENDGTGASETPLAEHLQYLFAQAGVGSELYCPKDLPDEFIECDALVEFAKIIGAYILKTVG